MSDIADGLRLDLHVDPQFVNRQLAAQAVGANEQASIGTVSDQITSAIIDRRVPDLRVMAIKDELSTLEHQLVTVRSGFYFRRTGSGRDERVRFHDTLQLGPASTLLVEGEIDPDRYEFSSAWGNLSGRRNVFIAGIVTAVEDEPQRVAVRPLLIGFPYYAPPRRNHPDFAPDRPELFCRYVDQFRLEEHDMMTPATPAQLERLFGMSEARVKQAFGTILGLSSVPADWGGEHSDLVADISVKGTWGRAAFAFKGPGGRPRPWTMYPSDMGKRGDQAARLFMEVADVMVVQHCSNIAESVRHVMDALATSTHRRYMLLNGDMTVRILNKSGLLS